MSDRKPAIAIIILNWNWETDTIECLKSIKYIEYPRYDVHLVDNNSRAESLREIISEFPDIISAKNFTSHTGMKSLVLHRNSDNLWFSEGNNIAIRFVNNLDYDHILLLNNDTVVDPSFLSELISVMEQDQRICIVWSKNLYYDPNDTVWYAGGKIGWLSWKIIHEHMNELDSPESSSNRQTDFCPWSSMLIRKGLLAEIGILQTEYFAYAEDLEYCIRTKAADMQIWYCWKSIVWHKVSRSFSKIWNFATYLRYRNVLWCMKKHLETPKMVIFNSLFVLRGLYKSIKWIEPILPVMRWSIHWIFKSAPKNNTH